MKSRTDSYIYGFEYPTNKFGKGVDKLDKMDRLDKLDARYIFVKLCAFAT